MNRNVVPYKPGPAPRTVSRFEAMCWTVILLGVAAMLARLL